jgi:UDPglucose--hexose-1-phosphate uridylyltransferase
MDTRVDRLTGATVVVAPGRAARPDTFRRPEEPRPEHVATCPFCPGNERATPPEVARRGPGAPDTPGWQVRVVPNLYPASAAHEVVITAPAHHTTLWDLPAAAVAEVVDVLAERSAHHLGTGCAHVQTFVNHGRAAGASIEHPHAQLVGLDFVPPLVMHQSRRFAAEPDLLAAAVAEARTAGFVIADDGAATVWCPPASVSPFVLRVSLPDPGPRLDSSPAEARAAAATALHHALRALHDVLGGADLNVVFHSGSADGAPFSWWIEIVPRVTVQAGFELGTGVLVNPADPAATAEQLRGAW